MREPPPHLSPESLVAALRDRYGLTAAEVEFLPLGNDAGAWVYRARTGDGAEYFVKVRARLPSGADLRVPRYLWQQGITQVVAPLPTSAGELWTPVGPYALIVYPYVAGTSGKASGGLTDSQWREYGQILRRIHDVAVPPDLERILPREQYRSPYIDLVQRLDATVETIGAEGEAAVPGDELAQALAAFWRSRRGEIRGLVARVETLGARLAQTEPPFVLTHGDAHIANVHLDGQGRVWIVDWDETALAPRERDLMFVVGGIHTSLVSERGERNFFEGYGPTVPDPLALAYYRYLWAVQDIGADGEQVLLMPDAGDVTRREGLQGLKGLFAPGAIVSIAKASRLPDR